MDNKKIIHMSPKDSFSLFWDEEGICIGGAEYLTLYDSSDYENGTTIELHVPGLQEWLDEYMWQCLVLIIKKAPESIPKNFNRCPRFAASNWYRNKC